MVHHIQENPKGLKLHFLFEASASLNPNKIAIIAGDNVVTYSELYTQSTLIARRIRAMGVKEGELVGVGMHRSISLAAAIMGILISGAAYVPMDPDMPHQRLEYICRDAEIKTIVTHTSEVSIFSALKRGCRLLLVDKNEQDQVDGFGIRGSRSDDTQADTAYVIYTSGSTGNPRGVVVSHESLSRFISAATMDLGILPGDTYLYMASISYAVSVRQLHVPLCRGATLIMASEEALLNPLILLRTIKNEGVTVMDVVPSYWRTMINILEKQPREVQNELLDNRLRMILSVGEPLSPDLPSRWKNTFGHEANVINIFGQTETTGYVAFHHVEPQDLEKETSIPIGRPRSHTRLMVLDDGLNSVQTGELYVDNSSLAEGYLNNPELTAEKFVPYPGSLNSKKIIYRSGDQVCLQSNGMIQSLGRSDNQVKINGIRIELEEIEAVLNRLPGVREAAATFCRQENRISVYVVPDGIEQTSVKYLRTHLKKILPTAVLPHSFRFRESLPKTLGGKLDRIALLRNAAAEKEIEKANREGRQNGLKYTDNTEVILLRLWQKYLQQDTIELEDNYFDLGGDSLRAVSIFDDVNRGFKKNIPITALLHAPTIKTLAAVIRGETGPSGDIEKKSVSIIPLKQENTENHPIFCLHGVGGGVMFYRDLVNHMTVDVNFYGIQVPEYCKTIEDNDERTNSYEKSYMTFTDLEEMAAYHLKEIRGLQPEGPYRLMGYSSGGIVAYEIARQLNRMGENVTRLVMLDTHLPLNSRCIKKNITPRLCFRFVKNLTPWLIDFCRDPENRRRFRRRIIKMTGNPAHLWYDLKNEKRRGLLQQQVKLLRAYNPGTYHGDVILIRSRVQDLLNPKPKDYGWSRYVAGKIDVYEVPGNHRSILKEPHLSKTAEKLSGCFQ
jgi:amino acid adenylation domain-containing protein